MLLVVTHLMQDGIGSLEFDWDLENCIHLFGACNGVTTSRNQDCPDVNILFIFINCVFIFMFTLINLYLFISETLMLTLPGTSWTQSGTIMLCSQQFLVPSSLLLPMLNPRSAHSDPSWPLHGQWRDQDLPERYLQSRLEATSRSVILHIVWRRCLC
jgi:hypothetical protein